MPLKVGINKTQPQFLTEETSLSSSLKSLNKFNLFFAQFIVYPPTSIDPSNA